MLMKVVKDYKFQYGQRAQTFRLSDLKALALWPVYNYF